MNCPSTEWTVEWMKHSQALCWGLTSCALSSIQGVFNVASLNTMSKCFDYLNSQSTFTGPDAYTNVKTLLYILEPWSGNECVYNLKRVFATLRPVSVAKNPAKTQQTWPTILKRLKVELPENALNTLKVAYSLHGITSPDEFFDYLEKNGYLSTSQGKKNLANILSCYDQVSIVCDLHKYIECESMEEMINNAIQN